MVMIRTSVVKEEEVYGNPGMWEYGNMGMLEWGVDCGVVIGECGPEGEQLTIVDWGLDFRTKRVFGFHEDRLEDAPWLWNSRAPRMVDYPRARSLLSPTGISMAQKSNRYGRSQP